MASIDRMDWHFGAGNFPDDVPEENGATHIGWFVRWAIGCGLFQPKGFDAPLLATKLDDDEARRKFNNMLPVPAPEQ